MSQTRKKTRDPDFDVETFLAHCARIGRADGGWMSAKDAHARSLTASADAALNAAKGGEAVDDADRETARASIAYFRERHAKALAAGRAHDFDQTVAANLDDGRVQTGTHRIVGAVMGMWMKAQATRGDQVGSAPGHHLGQVGQKVDLEVAVLKIATVWGNWGASYAVHMQAGDGARVTWFTARPHMREGRTYRLRGTIKDLREFAGMPQTVVTRCTAEEIAAEARA